MEGSSSKPEGRGGGYSIWPRSRFGSLVSIMALCCSLYSMRTYDIGPLDIEALLKAIFEVLHILMGIPSSRGHTRGGNADTGDVCEWNPAVYNGKQDVCRKDNTIRSNKGSRNIGRSVSSNPEERQNLNDALELQMPQDEGEEGRLDVPPHLQRLRSFTEEQRSRMRRLTSRGDTRRGDIDRSVSANSEVGHKPRDSALKELQDADKECQVEVCTYVRRSCPHRPDEQEPELCEPSARKVPKDVDEKRGLDNHPNLKVSVEFIPPVKKQPVPCKGSFCKVPEDADDEKRVMQTALGSASERGGVSRENATNCLTAHLSD
ncbi:uncharacterized protein LOC141790020 [Halichoeres trimaculatus]|uniref:uncharacterized protein LOC141790020 n=1 Tax=Halichoeres trimaculatus TaxID=147232 RepID=UPI003D9E3954